MSKVSRPNVYGHGLSILRESITMGPETKPTKVPETSFTTHTGTTNGLEYVIVRRLDGTDVCTASRVPGTKRWSGVEFVDMAMLKCNRTRQAAMRALQALEV